MKYSDEEIVKKVLAGEKQLFELLIDRYQQPVYNLMLRYAGNSDEAAELTQDTLVRTFERLRLFRADRTFFSWLYRLAINLAQDWSRKKSRQRTKMYLLQQQSIELHDDSEGKWDRETRQEIEQVEDGLMQLSSQTREILIFRYRHGRPIRDVANAFNLSESAAKMRIKRGLAKLREILLDKAG